MRAIEYIDMRKNLKKFGYFLSKIRVFIGKIEKNIENCEEHFYTKNSELKYCNFE